MDGRDEGPTGIRFISTQIGENCFHFLFVSFSYDVIHTSLSHFLLELGFLVNVIIWLEVNSCAVRNRMKSIKNIQKITKAMKMVAASKLRAIQTKAENSRGLWQPFTALLGDLPSMSANKPLICIFYRAISVAFVCVLIECCLMFVMLSC